MDVREPADRPLGRSDRAIAETIDTIGGNMNQLALVLKTEKRGQKQDILDWLNQYGSLTRMQAFDELGIVELSSRIGEIEKDGWTVPREQVRGRGRNGRPYTITRYLRPKKCEPVR